MKINMWKLLIAGLFASAALAGCEDNRNNFMVDDTLSFVNKEQYAGVSVYNGKYEFAILKNGKGQQSAKALLSVSETALAEYNAANGTNYAVLPANCYKLSSSTIGFSDGDTRKFVEVTWDDAAIFALGEGTEYAIPLELTTVNDALAVDANRNVKIINPKRASIGMEKELATPFHPTATHEEITFDGNIVLDNAITTMDLTVNYAIDNSLVEAYNQANGTNYLAAPEGFARLDAASSQIAAGETTAKFSGKINSDKLFTGSNLDIVGDLLVPVRITSASLDGITVTTEVMYVPFSMDKELKGPWKLLEGEDNCYAKDPNNGGAAWIMQYTADKLFDGEITAGHEWISWFATQIEFPITFVVDMGQRQVFTKFRISDYSTHQGNYRDYEIYTAEEYSGASTQWNLVASGKRDFNWTGVPTPYDYAVQKTIAGRYLKFVIVKPEYAQTGDYLYGRGKLADVQGLGF